MLKISHGTPEAEYANPGQEPSGQEPSGRVLYEDALGNATECWEVDLDPSSPARGKDDEEDDQEEDDQYEDNRGDDEDDTISDPVLCDTRLWYPRSIRTTVDQNPPLNAEEEKSLAQDVQSMRHYRHREQDIKQKAGDEEDSRRIAGQLVQELVCRIARESPMLWAAGLWLNLPTGATLSEALEEPELIAAMEAVPDDGMIAFIAHLLNIDEEDVRKRWEELCGDISILPRRVLARHGNWELRSLPEALDLIQADLTRGMNPSLYALSFRDMVSRGQEARDALVNANLRLAYALAQKIGHLRQRMDLLDDLIGEGNLALIKAAESFDHRKGTRFSTYATTCIVNAINRFIARNAGYAVQLRSEVLREQKKATRAQQQLADEFGRAPSAQEVAEVTGLKRKRVDRLLQASAAFQPPVYLYQQAPGAEDGVVFADILASRSPSVEYQVCHRILLQGLKAEVENLPDRERQLIKLRYPSDADKPPSDADNHPSDADKPPTLAAVGKKLGGITGERVRQLEKRVLQKLRNWCVGNE